MADFGAFKQGFLSMKLKRMQYDFPKMRAGGQRQFEIFLKIHPFWRRHLSLIEIETSNEVPPIINSNERFPWVYSEKCMSPMNIESRKEVSN